MITKWEQAASLTEQVFVPKSFLDKLCVFASMILPVKLCEGKRGRESERERKRAREAERDELELLLGQGIFFSGCMFHGIVA